jgi:hypothetical protein
MRHRTRSTKGNLFLAPQGDTRQFVALVLAMVLAVLLVPVGVQAAQTVNAFITDPGGVNQATVDADGNLSVSGDVTVNDSTPVVVSRADDPGRMAFADSGFTGFEPGDSVAFAFFDVPDGKRLVITYVSGSVLLSTGQVVREIRLVSSLTPPHGTVHRFVPIETNPGFFVFTQNTTIHADGEFQFEVHRSPNIGAGNVDVHISGYLIDCLAAASGCSSN